MAAGLQLTFLSLFEVFLLKTVLGFYPRGCEYRNRGMDLHCENSNLTTFTVPNNRFSVSNLHGRPRKNNPFGIYENIKLGLINYTLLGLIEHHGVFIDSGHYVSYIRQSNKWYHCDDKHITETNLLTLSNNVYLMFYAKEVDLGT